MLDSFIIQRIRDEEEERRREQSRRPWLEIPGREGPPPALTDEQDRPFPERGILIIDPDEA